MKWIRVICLLGWLAAGAQAADETRPAARRFLLVVEASSASAKCAPAIETAARQLVGGSFDGKMQPGDTLGVWVYQAGVDVSFPMQVWNPSAAWPVSQGIIDHLRRRKWDEPPIWENVLVALRKVAVASDDLTIAVISSPSSRLSTGGELDGRIGATYAQAEADLRLNKLPFVTFLAVRNGKLLDAAVNSGIGPWTIPDPPVLPRPQQNIASQPAVSAKAVSKKPSPAVPHPQIFIGSNAEQVFAAVASMPAVQPADREAPSSSQTESPKIVVPEKKPAVSTAVPTSPKTETSKVAAGVGPTLATADASTNQASSTTTPKPDTALPVMQTNPPAPATAAIPPPMIGPTVKRTAPIAPAMVASVDQQGTGYLFGAVGSVLVAAGALWWLLGNRNRNSMPTSLITRSMDRR
jgi:hypothetical protein